MRLIDADRKELLDFLYELEKGSKTDDAEMAVKELIGYVVSMPPAELQVEKAFRLFAEWAVECDFGYDNIPSEYEKYKDDIKGMDYTEGLIYIAMMEAEHEEVPYNS